MSANVFPRCNCDWRGMRKSRLQQAPLPLNLLAAHNAACAHQWLLLRTDPLTNCRTHSTRFSSVVTPLFQCKVKYGGTAYQLAPTDRKDGYIDLSFPK